MNDVFNIFENQQFSYGLVLRLKKRQIEQIRDYLDENGLIPVYQEVATENLWIKRGDKTQ